MAVTSALFDTSVGLLVNKLREEAEKLRESDVRREIDYFKLQLDGLARSHLLSSITFCREGVLHLFKLKCSTGEDQAKITQSGEGIEGKQVAVFASRSPIDRLPNLSRDLNDLKLTNLDDAEERALSAAKKDFEQARIKAIEAFSNESLPPCDRIQAMVIRVAATMLENVDHPEDALPVCISCLEELHALPEVKESFSVEINKPFKYRYYKEYRRQIISSVCRINHAVRNAAVMVAKKGELFSLPLIDNGVEEIDPLHDQRVAESLGKLEMQHYSVTALTLGQKNEKEKPKIPQGIASNSNGHFIVGDEWDRSIKIFDRDINFQSSFCGAPIDDENTIVGIADVATDIFDNVYVLVELHEKSSSTACFKIYLFDQQGNTKHHFFLRKETTQVLRVTVSRHNEILVLGDSSEENTKSVVDVYNPNDGEFIRNFGEKTLNRAEDLCATSDGRVVVLDRDDQGALSVLVFGPDDKCISDDFLKHFEEKERVITKLRSSIASHRESNHVVIAIPSEQGDPLQILRLDIDSGTFLPNILLPVEGLVSTRGISVTVEGRIALSLLDKTGGDSKVLVV